jgi:hypothetical protein
MDFSGHLLLQNILMVAIKTIFRAAILLLCSLTATAIPAESGERRSVA